MMLTAMYTRKHIHDAAVTKKVKQLQANSGGKLVCAYREGDLAFLFIAKELNLFRRLYQFLAAYHSSSQHPTKYLYPPMGMNS